MKRKRQKAAPNKMMVRVWTYPQAKNALPYITSAMRSAREHWLEAQSHEAHARRLDARQGRPDRALILARKAAQEERELALERLDSAQDELRQIEVFCIDPNQGGAVLPFVHEDRLGWLIYDLFDSEEYRQWRYHDDPPEKRRPIAEVVGPAPAKDLVV